MRPHATITFEVTLDEELDEASKLNVLWHRLASDLIRNHEIIAIHDGKISKHHEFTADEKSPIHCPSLRDERGQPLMSARNTREAKKARNAAAAEDLRRRNELRDEAQDLLDKSLHAKVRKLADIHNEKLQAASLKQLKEAYSRRIDAGETLPKIRLHNTTREQLIGVLTLTLEGD